MSMVELDESWPFKRDPLNPILPPPRLREIRELGEVVSVSMYDGNRVALATGYDDVRSILHDPGISSNGAQPGFPYVSDAARANRGTRPTIDKLDPPEHDDQRAMLARDFTYRRIETLRPFLEELVDQLLDDMAAAEGPIDFFAQFSQPIPAAAVAKLLDLPLSDTQFITDRVFVWMNDQGQPAEITQAMADITEYFERLIDERTGGDGTDLISRLVRDQVETGQLSRRQLLLTLHLLMTAGFDTTANAIALGTLVLLEHPTAWQELVENEDNDVLRGAIEELLRFLSLAHGTYMRFAKAPIPVGHQVIPAGTGVIAVQMTANHDPAHFPNPEEVDIHRDARDHLAFGTGIHQCLGQSLARLELNIVFSKLPKRFPNLALAVPRSELKFRPEASIYSVETMPMRVS